MFEWQVARLLPLARFVSFMRAIPDDSEVYHVHGSFGDVYFQLAALREVVGKSKSKVVVIIDEGYKKLASTALPQGVPFFWVHSTALNSLFNSIGLVGRVSGLPTRLLPTIYPACAEMIYSGALNYCNFLRALVGSDRRGPFERVETDQSLELEASEILNSTGCIRGRTVLISADNNTHLELPVKTWDLVIRAIVKRGWSVLLNDSGGLKSSSATILATSDLKRTRVPPHLPCTMSKIAGAYIGGTNGLTTIQALFGNECTGLHLINGYNADGNYQRDKGGNVVRLDHFFHSKTWAEQFLGTQRELVLSEVTTRQDIEDHIDSLINTCP